MCVVIVTESFPPIPRREGRGPLRAPDRPAPRRSRSPPPLVVALAPAPGHKPDAFVPCPVVHVPSLPLPGYPQVRVALPSRSPGRHPRRAPWRCGPPRQPLRPRRTRHGRRRPPRHPGGGRLPDRPGRLRPDLHGRRGGAPTWAPGKPPPRGASAPSTAPPTSPRLLPRGPARPGDPRCAPGRAVAARRGHRARAHALARARVARPDDLGGLWWPATAGTGWGGAPPHRPAAPAPDPGRRRTAAPRPGHERPARPEGLGRGVRRPGRPVGGGAGGRGPGDRRPDQVADAGPNGRPWRRRTATKRTGVPGTAWAAAGRSAARTTAITG